MTAVQSPTDLPSAIAVINELTVENQKLVEKSQELEQQLDWFKRQIFGEKSEKLIRDLTPSRQLWIGGEEPKTAAGQQADITVKEYVRKRNGKQALEDDCGESGLAVLERSYADVSLLAGIFVDKIQYYSPLYRQHQRMTQAGIKIARGNLTHWFHRGATLLEPIYRAVLGSVLKSLTLAMDETPLKAGQDKKGKLHRGYVWVLYGDKDEVVFLYSPTRARTAVEPHVKQFCGTLVTDGYTVYDQLCARYKKIVHALCWAHARREFFEALKYEPARSQKALDHIGKLYEQEAEIRDAKLSGEKKLAHRVEYERPIVDTFFDWLKAEVAANTLLPSNRFYKAAAYALEREAGLRVYLSDPAVPIDTNHLERELRPLPMGRKNWMFCWTEVGAEAVAIIETLIGCCKLHGVNPFEYLVDVLERIDSHPAARVAELTPREWAAARRLKKAATS